MDTRIDRESNFVARGDWVERDLIRFETRCQFFEMTSWDARHQWVVFYSTQKKDEFCKALGLKIDVLESKRNFLSR